MVNVQVKVTSGTNIKYSNLYGCLCKNNLDLVDMTQNKALDRKLGVYNFLFMAFFNEKMTLTLFI